MYNDIIWNEQGLLYKVGEYAGESLKRYLADHPELASQIKEKIRSAKESRKNES